MTERRRIKTTDWREVITPERRLIMGIDPGMNGGLAVTETGPNAIMLVKRMPEGNDELWAWLQQYAADPTNITVFIEAVYASPQQGVTGAFTFGCGFGKLLMACAALGTKPKMIRPVTWQRALQIPKTRKAEDADYRKDDGSVRTAKGVKAMLQAEHKEIIRQLAQRLYPSLAVWNKTKAEQMSVCDALLICHYGKIMECGNEPVQGRSGISSRGEESPAV